MTTPKKTRKPRQPRKGRVKYDRYCARLFARLYIPGA